MANMEQIDTNPKRALRVREFGTLYGLSKATIYRLIKIGKLRSIKLGGCRLIPVDSAESLISIN